MNAYRLFLALPVFMLVSCAQTYVSKTYIANDAPAPEAIYVRLFDTSRLQFRGGNYNFGGRELQKAQVARKFAQILQEELAMLAPAALLEDNERAPVGWIIEGEMDLVDGGSRVGRALLGNVGVGMSFIQMHVTVIDAKSHEIIYAFDVAGGSGLTGPLGNTGAPGIGMAESFDFRNAAETIYETLAIDEKRTGYRHGP